MKKRNFALIGAAGYIAPRHMKAIKEINHHLLAVMDPHDSVGVLDSYFPEAFYFNEFERFDRHIEKLRRKNSGREIHYISICSPNYLHDAHVRFALRSGADAICEKPLVLNPWNLDGLEEISEYTGRKVYNILQLRLHPTIMQLKKQLEHQTNTVHDIELTYITSRGNWYSRSWKGDEVKSGGVTTNIGIHFFDMLQWLFGKPSQSKVHLREWNKASGFIQFPKARVKWFLSIDEQDLLYTEAQNGRTWRSVKVNGEEVEFSDGFTDLHTLSYQHILAGNGFGIEQARPAIEMVHHIRNVKLAQNNSDIHPLSFRIKQGLPAVNG
ncbi:MAG: Gfo/Idh/MocA family oxidoreductase [Hahellaceae bacterium]|nr:Gfo/Idh/MocA family oxidoreductase [Hahellaceae bacterium]MCP5211753.1 Gfo/Idh/MocA family oxidoreductase [Hahellaceae bacterium]